MTAALPEPRDIRSYRLDCLFFVRVWRLAAPYWMRTGAWGSWLALAVLCGLVATYGISGAIFSYLTKHQTDALVDRNAALFWHFLWLNTAFFAARYLSDAVSKLVSGRLNLHWRRWLTTYLIDKYLSCRTYYDIASNQEIDNPDQRIQECVDPFCTSMTDLPTRVVGTVADMGIQGFILITISPALTWVVAGLAVIQTLTILFLYRPTIKQNYEIAIAEADLRHGILHVRDNAETVAFYRGEYAERTHIIQRLNATIRANLTYILYGVWMVLADRTWRVTWSVLPLIFLAPLYLHYKIQYGTIAQGTILAATLLDSLSIFMDYIPRLSTAVPNVIRLAEIEEKCDQLAVASSDSRVPRIRLVEGESISLTGVSLLTPSGEHSLIQDATLRVDRGAHLAIVGRTGIGKSSLLRAMAGLWTRGSGIIVMPPPERALFLPQKPYMILGNLREQLLYPRRRTDISENEIQSVLDLVQLSHLRTLPGGLSATADWERILSLGEQQRIAFARVLLNRPDYVFLDEATSAVDTDMEYRLYQLLEATGATYVSIGHRSSILTFHRHILRLQDGGRWDLSLTRAEPMEILASPTAR